MSNHPAAVMVFLALVLGVHAGQKPVVEAPIIEDFMDVPPTLEGLLARSDAAALLRVLNAREVSHGGRVRTSYEMQVVQTFKEHHRLGGTSNVCLGIGTREYPDRTVKIFIPHFPAFSVGSDYLLFLTWNEADGCFWPTFGPASAASIAPNGKVRPFVNNPGMHDLNGVARSELRSRMAAAQKK